MNWAKILWWVVTNAPELFQLIKRIIDLLEEAGGSQQKKAVGTATATVRGKSAGKLHATIRADLR